MEEQVLVIEDSPEFQQIARESLTRAGYRVAVAGNGERGLELARSLMPLVILLDLTLPDADGIELCKELRTFTNAYIIMVTGKTDEVDKLVGLAVGADDYVTKPYSTRELIARIGVILRRPRALLDEARTREIGDVFVDVSARTVSVDGQAVALTKIEFDILDALTVDPAVVRSRASLIEAVWGSDWVGDTHVIDVHVANLRKKLDANGTKHITTVRGVGFRFASTGAGRSAAA